MESSHSPRILFHPFLFAIIPIVFLYAHNIDEVHFFQTVRALQISAVLTLCLGLLLFAIFRQSKKALLALSLLLLLSFHYASLVRLLIVGIPWLSMAALAALQYWLLRKLLAPSRYIIWVWLLLLGAGAGFLFLVNNPFLGSPLFIATSFVLLVSLGIRQYTSDPRIIGVAALATATGILSLNAHIEYPLMASIANVFSITSWKPHVILALIASGTLLAMLWLLRTSRELSWAHQLLNGVALLSFLFALVQIVTFELSQRSQRKASLAQGTIAKKHYQKQRVPPPDIYYIILDEYARSDALQEFIGFDNRPFLRALVKKGFTIGTQSFSNYSQTQLSLASSLNLHYAQTLLKKRKASRRALISLIKHSSALHFLRWHGYEILTFDTGIAFSQMEDADVFLSAGFSISEFEQTLLGETFVPLLFRRNNPLFAYLKRRRISYTLKQLGKLPHLKRTTPNRPRFVFAHLLLPHSPFVFDENGNPSTPSTLHDLEKEPYQKHYRQQIKFTTKAILKVAELIIQRSSRPPIVIIQGDHGTRMNLIDFEKWPVSQIPEIAMRERMTILNAYYLPTPANTQTASKVAIAPYPSISPVNTFRMIFNRYLGASFPLLPDRSYFSQYNRPFVFREVTKLLKRQATTKPTQQPTTKPVAPKE